MVLANGGAWIVGESLVGEAALCRFARMGKRGQGVQNAHGIPPGLI